MEMRTLSALETQLKARWLHAGGAIPQKAVQLEDWTGDVPGDIPMTKVLEESTYFEPEQDAACNCHPRYLPPLLHRHTFFEVACVLSGECTNFINGEAVPLAAGDICILAPDTVHALAAFSDAVDVRNIMLKTSTFEERFMSLMEHNDILSQFFRKTFFSGGTRTPYLLFHAGNDEALCALINRIYEESHLALAYKRRILGALIDLFFITLLRSHEQDVVIPAIRDSALEDSFVFLLLYLQEHCRTVTLQELSRLFNYSPRQMQRIIKNATGMSFLENVQKLRMEKAADLLAHTDRTVEQVARETGYESLNNFRAIFRRTYGCTPQEWRKAHGA